MIMRATQKNLCLRVDYQLPTDPANQEVRQRIGEGALGGLAHIDLPEGEAPNWPHFSYMRWASSANHMYDRPVTSSETWTWTHPPMFRATPLDLKAVADLHFLEGINQLIGHGHRRRPSGTFLHRLHGRGRYPIAWQSRGH
jgi:hypothetical protein